MTFSVHIMNEAGDKAAPLSDEQFAIAHDTIIGMMNGSMSAKKAEARIRKMLSESPHPIADDQWKAVTKRRKP